MATVSDHTTLSCPVCFKRYVSPRLLPCLHTLCETCLDAHVASQTGSGKECLCPLCHSSIVQPDHKMHVDKWAKAFPLNSLICSLLESAEVSDDNTCEPCKSDGETMTAEYWCTECHERLCRYCNRLHKRNKQLKLHNLIPIAEMEQDNQSKIDFDQKCVRHNEALKLFCVDHRKVCCAICIATDHRQCNGIRMIDDMAREQTQRSTPAYPRIVKDIKNIGTEMKKILSSKTKHLTEISKAKQQIIRDMDKRIDTIITDLNKLRIEFRNEIDRLHKITESSILKDRKIVQSFLTNVDNSEEILEVVSIKGSAQQNFTTFENITTQLTSHYQQLKSCLSEDTEVRLQMKPSKLLNDIEGAMKTLATVQLSTKPSTSTIAVLQNTDEIIRKANSRTTVMCAAQVQKRNVMTSPWTFVKAVTLQELGGRTYLTGGAFCSDGRLLMADYNNNRLLQFDDKYNVVKEYKADDRLTDVAMGNDDNEIFMIVNKNIYKCTLDTDLTVVSRIKAPGYACGIAAIGDNIIVGTPTAVVILKQDGSTVKSISRSGYVWSYVETSQSDQTIYHTDNYNDIVSRSLDGKELSRYQSQQLRGPLGIAMDKHNNIYTCGCGSHSIHQVSLDSNSGRIIVDTLHSISRPLSVMLHPKGDELIVTSDGENTVFEVYRLV